jgi:hypothetical protein
MGARQHRIRRGCTQATAISGRMIRLIYDTEIETILAYKSRFAHRKSLRPPARDGREGSWAHLSRQF